MKQKQCKECKHYSPHGNFYGRTCSLTYPGRNRPENSKCDYWEKKKVIISE